MRAGLVSQGAARRQGERGAVGEVPVEHQHCEKVSPCNAGTSRAASERGARRYVTCLGYVSSVKSAVKDLEEAQALDERRATHRLRTHSREVNAWGQPQSA